MMRLHYWVALALLVAITYPAEAQQHRPAERPTAKSNVEFLRDLTNRIEDAGYTSVRMIPQMFVVIAVRSDGKPVTLLVDSNSLKATEVEGAQEFIREATGMDPLSK